MPPQNPGPQVNQYPSRPNPSFHPEKSFIEFRQVAGGVVTTGDPQDNKDDEVSDALNMIFRNGYPESRPGAKVKWFKPASETNSLLNLFRTRDSNGNEYPIAVYAPNFYVRDEVNNQWIKINHTYTPSTTYITYPYSYVNWNQGRSKDVLYAGNGQEDCIKWQISMRYLTIAATIADSTLTIDDATFFPSTGSLVIKESGGNEIYATLSSKSGNILTLSAPIGTAVSSGAAVTFEITDMSATLPKGKVMCKNGGRLFIANGRGSECTVSFSVVGNAEDFSTSTGATGSGFEVITDGERDITSLQDFGEYILIQKANSAVKLSFEINADLNAFTTKIVPVFQDVSMGPANSYCTIKKNNLLYFVTPKEGVYSMDPGITGQQTSVKTDVVSMPIQNYITTLDMTNSRATSFNQYLLWTAASQSVSDKVLVYDIVRSKLKGKDVWTFFDDWQVQDWMVHNDSELLFADKQTGSIVQAFDSDYSDTLALNSPAPYVTSFISSRYDHGFYQTSYGSTMNKYPSKFKRSDLLHVQGYMTVGTIYVDIMYEENGKLQKITKSWSSVDDLVYQGLSPALAMMMLGLPIMGGTIIDDLDNLGIFNFYIPTPIKYGYTNITFKFYSNVAGLRWGLTGYGFNPMVQNGIPPQVIQQS